MCELALVLAAAAVLVGGVGWGYAWLLMRDLSVMRSGRPRQ